jgi:CRISPR-associated protein Cmr3
MQQLLNGKSDRHLNKHLYPLFKKNAEENALACLEPKMGLARSNQTRMTEEGMLFAVAPVRMAADTALAIEVENLDADHYPQNPFIQKLGGEGKMASISVGGQWRFPKHSLNEIGSRIRFKLVCVTPALMQAEDWLPSEHVEKKKDNGRHIWRVQIKSDRLSIIANPIGALIRPWRNEEIRSCSFDIVSACIGKPLRQSGWNHQLKCPRKLRGFIPAGSVYFCEADILQKENILKLHGKKIGQRTQYGFGQVLVGRW